MTDLERKEYEEKYLKCINKLGEMIEDLSDGRVKVDSVPEKLLDEEEIAELEAKAKALEEEILRQKQLEEAQNDAKLAVLEGLFRG